MWAGHTQIIRRHASPRQWLGVEREVLTLTLGAVDLGSAIATLLVVPGAGLRLKYITGHPLTAPDPLHVTAALDALLLQFQRPSKG